MPARICPNCHAKNYSTICTNCGAPIPEESALSRPVKAPPVTPVKSKSTEESSLFAPIVPVETEIYAPISSHPLGSTGRTSVITPPNPLPADLARRDPLLEGEIIEVNTLDIEDKSLKPGNVVKTTIGCLMLPFNFMAGIFTLLSGASPQKETKRVTVARIRTPKNEEYEVRVEKDMSAATFGIGDYISIWGFEKNGVYYMQSGFNHHTKGRIKLA